MDEIVCEKFNTGCFMPQDIDAIVRWSEESGSVLTITPEDMKRHPYGVMIKHMGDLGLLGYAAIKELSDEAQLGQLGSLIISPLCLGNNIATQCVEYVLRHAPENLPSMKAAFAYGNQKSTPLFLKLGGQIVGTRPQPSPTGCNDVIDLSVSMGLPGIEEASLADILKVNETAA